MTFYLLTYLDNRILAALLCHSVRLCALSQFLNSFSKVHVQAYGWWTFDTI